MLAFEIQNIFTKRVKCITPDTHAVYRRSPDPKAAVEKI